MAGDYSTYLASDRWREYGTPGFKAKKLERVLLPGQDVRSRIAKKNGITDETP